MSKASELRELLKIGIHPVNAAEEVGCTEVYARATLSRMRNKERFGDQRSPASRDRQNEYQRKRYLSDPEYRERVRRYSAEYYARRARAASET